MKVCIQTVAADFLPVEIAVGAQRYFADMFFFCNSTHNSEYLAGEHHPYLVFVKTFDSIPMVVIIAVEPSPFAVYVNPFLCP